MSAGIDAGLYRVNIVSIDSSARHPARSETPTAVLAIRGIRAARNVLGDRLGSTLKRSKDTYEAALSTLPQLVGSTDDQETALEAARAAETHSDGVLGCEVASEPVEAQEPAGDAGETRLYQVAVKPDGSQATGPDDKPFEIEDAILVRDFEASGLDIEVVSCALIAMATANGNPSVANTYAGSYRLHSDSGLWGGVQDLLEHVFPTSQESP